MLEQTDDTATLQSSPVVLAAYHSEARENDSNKHNLTKRYENFNSSPPAAYTAPLRLPVQLKSLCFLSPVAGSVFEAEQCCRPFHFHARASNSPQQLLDPVQHC